MATSAEQTGQQILDLIYEYAVLFKEFKPHHEAALAGEAAWEAHGANLTAQEKAEVMTTTIKLHMLRASWEALGETYAAQRAAEAEALKHLDTDEKGQ